MPDESASQVSNFHTHTQLCHHASGMPRDYCRCAVEQGVTVLGFADHNPFTDAECERINRTSPSTVACRMSYCDLPLYREEIRQAAAEFPELRVYAGLEIDFFPEIGIGFYQDLAGTYQLDYLLGGEHTALRAEVADVPPETRALKAAAGTVKMLESGLLLYLCHPDLFAGSRAVMTPNVKAACRDMLAAAADLHVPLEFNAYGLRKKQLTDLSGVTRPPYPWRDFWELAAEYPVTVVLGTDAHKPEDVWSNGEAALAQATAWGIHPDNRILLEKMEKNGK